MKHTESYEQRCLVAWASAMTGRFPVLRLLYAVPNGGKRLATEAKIMKGEGVRAGIPDLVLPARCGDRPGLYLEMKAPGGRLRPEQREWLESLARQGYATAVAWGFEEGASAILDYLRGGWPAGDEVQEYRNSHEKAPGVVRITRRPNVPPSTPTKKIVRQRGAQSAN